MSDSPKKLYRSRESRQVAGVCGGLANYFNLDVSIVRLIFVLMTFMGGPGLLLYIALAIVVPEEPSYDYDDKRKNDFA